MLPSLKALPSWKFSFKNRFEFLASIQKTKNTLPHISKGKTMNSAWNMYTHIPQSCSKQEIYKINKNLKCFLICKGEKM